MARRFSSQTKIKSNKYKYGIQVPTEYAHALESDKQNGNNLLQ